MSQSSAVVCYTESMSDNYTDVLLEEINSKFDRLIEVVGNTNDELQTKASAEDVQEVKSDIKVIKAAVIDTSHQVTDLQRRTTLLENHA